MPLPYALSEAEIWNLVFDRTNNRLRRVQSGATATQQWEFEGQEILNRVFQVNPSGFTARDRLNFSST